MGRPACRHLHRRRREAREELIQQTNNEKITEGVHGKIECTPSKHIPYVCQTKNNLHKFFYWLHLVYNTDYHQPMRWLRAMLLRLEQVSVNDAMCFSGTALRCMPGRSHSPGRGPGLTESASALRTSDAGLLPESLYRRRCGRRMQGCCRSRCAGGVADIGCRVVAGVAVQEALRTSGAGLLLDVLLPVFVAQQA